MDIKVKALTFATAAHAAVGQLRKYTNEPYIVHPVEVAGIVSKVPGATDEMIAGLRQADRRLPASKEIVMAGRAPV